MKLKNNKIIYVSIVFLLIFSTFIYTASIEYKRAYEEEKRTLLNSLTLVKSNFESLITGKIVSLNGIIAYVELHEDFNQDQFSAFVEKLYNPNDGVVRAMTFIKDTTITHVYPYRSNVSVIGKDLALDYQQSQSVLFCKERKIPVFDAPVNLIQGGLGMISRIPILDKYNEYIGQLSIVFNFEESLDGSGILALGRNNDVVLTGMDPFTGEEKVIWSNIDSERKSLEEPLTKEIRLYDSNLYLNVVPKDGWGIKTNLFKMLILIGFFIASVSSAGFYKILSNREKIQKSYYEILEQEEHIKFLADHDPLTDLFNRRKLVEKIKENIDKNINGTLILLDIDDFKNINDTLGHAYGDKLLKHMAKVLLSLLKDKSTIYRLGGDEYYILLEGITLKNEIESFLGEVISEIENNNYLEGIRNHITTSMGIVSFPEDGSDVNELLMKVDLAMYSAKKSGKNQYKFFNDQIISAFDEQVGMEKKLREALENGDFEIEYQPVICAKTLQMDYFEALVRMYDRETNSLVLPGSFISIAESTGIIVPLGKMVFNKVFQQLSIIKEQGITPRPISVNLSPRQVNDPELYGFLKRGIEENNIDPSLIEIEITESVLMENSEENIKILERIKDLGINIALDDFGTGYSSMNYLTYLPVDKIKFDRSLKDKIVYHENNKVMSGLIEFVHGLGLKIVAEGIEETEEVVKLKKEGCDFFQGYLFARPLKKEDMIKCYNFNYFEHGQ
jgi:diguanylate cyclase (GGDEF)-like protein